MFHSIVGIAGGPILIIFGVWSLIKTIRLKKLIKETRQQRVFGSYILICFGLVILISGLLLSVSN